MFRCWFLACVGLAALVVVACGTPFGIYHKVESGQTLYRIAQTYNVDLEKLIRINRIQDPTALKAGDMIFVPGADRPRQVPITAAGAAAASSTHQAKQARSPVRETAKPGGADDRERVRIDGASAAPVVKSTKSAWAGGDAPSLIWPVDGQVTSYFGQRDGSPHDGIDIAAPEGAPIVAAADGRVIYADDALSGYGNMVIVRHSGSWATVYAHNRENLVQSGEFVVQGQKLATVGDTGRASAPHLHFEVRFGKIPKDPLQYLPARTAGR